jgi:hypothetical protein
VKENQKDAKGARKKRMARRENGSEDASECEEREGESREKEAGRIESEKGGAR